MYLKVEKEKRIADIQKEFNKHYPYLKIEFYNKSHEKNHLSPSSEIIDPGSRIRSMGLKEDFAHINITKDRKVSQVEADFEKDMGLFVQVFRKAGNVWIGTSRTDGWTLERQNEEGAYFSSEIPIKTIDQKIEENQIDAE